jgi:GNAT superfamily N-acetyltransferase
MPKGSKKSEELKQTTLDDCWARFTATPPASSAPENLRQQTLTECWPNLFLPQTNSEQNGATRKARPPKRRRQTNGISNRDRKTVKALRDKYDPENDGYIAHFQGPIVYFHYGESEFYAMDSTLGKNVWIAEATLHYEPDTDQFWLNHISVDTDYQKKGIGTNLLRAIIKYLKETDDILMIPATNQKNDDGLYLTTEGAALINSCIRKKIIKHEQCLRDFTPTPMDCGPGV